ncbi:MAG: LysM peptidoglycan-binding domain-containing protein [Flavobacterium sp.]
MKTRLLLAGFLLMACANVSFAQMQQQQVNEQVAVHRVKTGETVVLVAKKYMVTPHDIYELNPDAVNGIAPGQGLRIPVSRKVKEEIEAKNLDYEMVSMDEIRQPAEKKAEIEKTYTASTSAHPVALAAPVKVEKQAVAETPSAMNVTTATPHKVASGETLTSLARKYNTTIEAITAANQAKLKKGLQAGQELIIPAGRELFATTVPDVKEEPVPAKAKEAIAETTTETINTGTHHVVPGETLIGLSRKYNTTVEAIIEANQKTLRRGLQAGQTLVIPGAHDTASAEAATPSANAEVVYTEGETVEHHVASGETLTGLARRYNTTIDAITENNKNKLKRGLQAGQVLSIIAHASN